MARRIVVIPGIGGHPRFHGAFIDALGGAADVVVLSWPHGDFFTQPFAGIGQHAAYWSERIGGAFSGDEAEDVSLVAISFGGAIACALPFAVLRRLHRVVLVSPWFLSPFAASLVGGLHRLPRGKSASLFGKLLFQWSDRSIHDNATLRSLRDELYDSEEMVHRRLWSRFICMGAAPDLSAFLEGQEASRLHAVFGSREAACWLARLRLATVAPHLRARLVTHAVPGSHSVSLNGSAHLTRKVLSIIGG